VLEAAVAADDDSAPGEPLQQARALMRLPLLRQLGPKLRLETARCRERLDPSQRSDARGS